MRPLFLGLTCIAALSLTWCTFDGLDAYSARWGASDAAPADGGIDSAADVAVEAGKAEAGSACLSSPFGSASLVTELNSAAFEAEPQLSPDELSVYFVSNRPSGAFDVYTASRTSKTLPFGSVAKVNSLNIGGDTWNVTITGNALGAFFVSDTALPDGGGANRMYWASRPNTIANFGTAALLPSPVIDGAEPYVIPDGTALYYSNQSVTPYRISRAALSGGSVLSVGDLPVTVAGADGGNTDVGLPVVNPNETIMYFAIWNHLAADTNGTFDIWMTTRAKNTDPWGAPSPVKELNTPVFEAPSWTSPDGCELYFTRDDGNATAWDMYVARRP